MRLEGSMRGKRIWIGMGVVLVGLPSAGHSRERGRECDAAYPTVCIPSPPPDLNCAHIRYRNFKVLPPDPHRFDGDRDGIGCEQ